ncbi:hypothetical protein [Streptococcus gallolyticus]|nr:hypothetical protein [Streptococcus gallolyticus]
MDLQNEQTLVFDEVETSELNGNVRDAIEGFGVGITIVAAAAALT